MNKQTYEHIAETIYSKTLPNGLPVILLPKPEMAKTYALFATNYGSIDQSFVPLKGTKKVTVPDGIAHFLEHKLFEKEDRDVFADFSKLGASPNAYTSFTKTAYLFSATSQIEKNVEILLDFVQDPFFSDESVEKEKGIIAQEITMYDDQPEWRSFMETVKGMFKHHHVNVDIAGTIESINQITKEDLYLCYETFYHPSNMALFVVGNFDPHPMMSMIEENQLSKTFIEASEIKRYYPEEPRAVAMKNRKINLPVSIPKCTVGIKESTKELYGEAFLKKDLLQSMVIDHYFSKGGSFYQQLYSENLIDNSFYFNTSLEHNFGYSLIGSNTNKPEEFAHLVKQLLLSTNESQFTNVEIETMKHKKIGQILRAMNSLEYIAGEYLHYHSFGIDFFNIIPTIQSLTKEEFTSFVTNWISEDRLTACTIEKE